MHDGMYYSKAWDYGPPIYLSLKKSSSSSGLAAFFAAKRWPKWWPKGWAFWARDTAPQTQQAPHPCGKPQRPTQHARCRLCVRLRGGFTTGLAWRMIASMTIGRPSSYTDEIADAICERLADGESLRSICRDEGMPNKATVFRWAAVNESFRDQYAKAREAQADCLFDDILEIADDGRNDWMERHGKDDAGWLLNGDHIARSKVRIDARKWMAGKLRPKVYGDRSIIQGPGENGEHTVKVSPDDAFQRLASRLGSAATGTTRGDPQEE